MTVHDHMLELAANARTMAEQTLGHPVDLDDAGVAAMDGLLDRVRARLDEAGEQRDRVADATAMRIGAYLGEVLRDRYGGTWMTGAPDFPPSLPVLEIEGPTYLPTLGVVRALVDGEAIEVGNGVADTLVGYVEAIEAWRAGDDPVDAAADEAWAQAQIMGDAASVDAIVAEMADDPKTGGQLANALMSALVTGRQKWQVDFEFTRAGVERLENVLHLLAATIEQGTDDDEAFAAQVRRMTFILGAFLGEAARRIYGGRWALRDVEGQGKVLMLDVVRGETRMELYPLARVDRRLHEGVERNVVTWLDGIPVGLDG
jgi:hypothetical protein